MKRLFCFFIVFIMMTVQVQAAENIKVNSLSAVLIDATNGRVLWGKNEETPMAMASTTKIMTAIIALENADLKSEVTVSKRAASAPEVKMGLKTGEKIRLEDLMFALMLQSSNDAAIAIAEHIGGTVENFCEMMTNKAKEIGAKDTLFVTPNGLDAGDHHSTAYDMAIIAKYALENEEFVKLIGTKEVTTPVSGGNYKSYHITNKNRLLNEYEGATGVKTGFTNKAGHCFVGSAKRDGVELVSVVLASGWGSKGKEQKWIDTKTILNYGFSNYSNEKIINKGETAGKIKVLNSPENNEIEVLYNNDFEMLMSQEEKLGIKIVSDIPDVLEAPVYKGQTVGKAEIYINDELMAEVELIAEKDAREYNFKDWIEKIKKELLGIR